MNLLIRLLPIILIIVVFYLLFYNIYPLYQQTISLAQQLNQLQNKEKEIDSLEKLKNALIQNPNIKQLLSNKETLNLWIPEKPKTEELVIYLNGIYQENNLVFRGVEFKILEEPKVINQSVLPLKVINFNLSAKLTNDNLMNFINGLERSVRIMFIKKAKLTRDNSNFEVESYFLSPE